MSQLKVDTITDEAGTGSPSLPNGLTVGGVNYPSTGPLSNRNKIINGAMQVHQRGDQTSVSSNSYSLDRWEVATTGGTAVYDLKQSTDVPTGQGFANSFQLDVTTADTAMGAGDGYIFRQAFEGQDLQGLKKGTSNAEQVTVQFWVKSPKAGTHILELFDIDNTRQVSAAYSVASADTWEKFTITFPADTTGAFDNDNARSLILQWWLAAGTDFTSGTLQTTWASAVSANRVVGQVNCLDNTANNFYITGVQLEAGTVATPFEHRSYGQELALCQRYCYRHSAEGDIDNFAPLGLGRYYGTNLAQLYVPFKVTMRTSPGSVTQVGNIIVNDTTFASAAITLVLNETSSSGATVIGTTTTGVTAGNATTFYASDTSSAALIFSAEL
jgi:hypothetical protein